MGDRPDEIAETDWLTERIAGWICTWREYLADREDEGLPAVMRLHENTGRPLGSQPFVEKLEALLGRKLLPGTPGRPKKTRK